MANEKISDLTDGGSLTSADNIPFERSGSTYRGQFPQDLDTTDSPSFAALTIDNILIDGNSLSITNTDGNFTIVPNGTGHVDIFNPPATEVSGINVNGVTYDSALRVNDIGGNSPAQFIVHRHSTTLQPVILGARANSDTDSHIAVTTNMNLFSIIGAGWTGSHYDLFGQINIFSSPTGSISSTSSPGLIEFETTPDGSNAPIPALQLLEDQSAVFFDDVQIPESKDLRFGSNAILSDAAGTMTLSNVDALDSTTTTTIQNAMEEDRRYKTPVIVGTGSNITLSGEQTIDGVLTASSRVLVREQTDDTENGIYVSDSGAWTRATDANTGDEFLGMMVMVLQGTVLTKMLFTCTNTTAPSLGADDITFSGHVSSPSDSVRFLRLAIGTEVPPTADATNSELLLSNSMLITGTDSTDSYCLIGRKTEGVKFNVKSDSGSNALIDFNAVSHSGSSGATIRFFAQTNDTGTKSVQFCDGLGGGAQHTIGVDEEDITFYTDMLTIDYSASSVGINETAPSASLHVKQDSTTAAIPVLELEQLDADQPLINFVGTTGGDTTSTISTLPTSGAVTHHLQCEINGTKFWIPGSTTNPS